MNLIFLNKVYRLPKHINYFTFVVLSWIFITLDPGNIWHIMDYLKWVGIATICEYVYVLKVSAPLAAVHHVGSRGLSFIDDDQYSISVNRR